MNRTRRLLLLVTAVVVALSIAPTLGFASEIGYVTSGEEIDLPPNLNFTVNEACTGHAYFMQAAANEVGDFAVFSLHVNPNDHTDIDYKKAYIDIYHSDGTFLQELSFTTSESLAFEFNEDTIYIYFYSSVLVYDLKTQGLCHYAIPKGSAVNGGKYDQLREKEFTAGSWVYTCKKSLGVYTTLIRSNHEKTQVLVEMPGNSNLWKAGIPGIVSGIVIVLLSIAWQRKRKQSNKDTTARDV